VLHLVERPGRRAVRAAWAKRYPVTPLGGSVASYQAADSNP